MRFSEPGTTQIKNGAGKNSATVAARASVPTSSTLPSVPKQTTNDKNCNINNPGKKNGDEIKYSPNLAGICDIPSECREKVRIWIINYMENHYEEVCFYDVERLSDYQGRSGITWINIDGIHDLKLIEKVGLQFALHPMTIAGITDVPQRPSFEDYDDYVFATLQMITRHHENHELQCEQVSFIIMKNMIITFQQVPGDLFDPVRNRLRTCVPKKKILSVDYLAYLLMDAIVDNYFVLVDEISDKIEEMEERILEDPLKVSLEEVSTLSQEMIFLRRWIWPTRDLVDNVLKSESDLIEERAKIYFKDLYDHVMQILDQVETYKEISTSLLDIYLSTLNNSTDEIMKRLTVISCIFTPLVLLTSIWGMSEWSMMTGTSKESWILQYAGFFLFMGVIAVITYLLMRWRRWI